MSATAAQVIAIGGLIFGFVAAVLMYYFPARVIQYTEKGEGQFTWVNIPSEEGKRRGRIQIFLSKLAPWLLAAGFLLQLPALALPLLAQRGQPTAPVSDARDARQVYEFEERCSKRIAELWKDANREEGNRHEKSISGYTNHYNKKLNKCFAIMSYLSDAHLMTLIDVNESRDIGTFYAKGIAPPTDCKVGGKICRSVQEWETLIKPYMEE